MLAWPLNYSYSLSIDCVTDAELSFFNFSFSVLALLIFLLVPNTVDSQLGSFLS